MYVGDGPLSYIVEDYGQGIYPDLHAYDEDVALGNDDCYRYDSRDTRIDAYGYAMFALCDDLYRLSED